MKKTINSICATILLISIAVVTTRCKSPQKPIEINTDTIVQIDSQKTITDSIVKNPKKVKRTPLILTVTNLASPTAPVIVGIYNSKHLFMYKESRIKEYAFIPHGNTLSAQIIDINYGEIAIAIYQDLNSNGKFDKNIIGMPTEGYAFSNNFRPKIKAPDYDDCKFDYNSTTPPLKIQLIK